MPGLRELPALALAGFTILAPAASAQTPGGIVRAPAGARYDAGALHRWLFGNEYRDLWTTPIAVEVLDLATSAETSNVERNNASRVALAAVWNPITDADAANAASMVSRSALDKVRTVSPDGEVQ
ncbi:MAG TPA: hypothetical protein VGA22_05940 [Gemmatimonadales bacterium]|jgi:hypothetical protein